MARGDLYKSTSGTLDESSSNQATHRVPVPVPAPARKQSLSNAGRRRRTRLVSVDDDELVGIASTTRAATDWEAILMSARAGPGRWRVQHSAGDFTVYSRQESHRYGVLAVGLIEGGAGEIMNVLQCQGSAQYAQQMAAVFEEQFKDGWFVHQVPRASREPHRKGNRVELVDLAVKTVTFQKLGWLGSHEQWCYLDAVYRHGDTGAAEKLMTTLDPKTVIVGSTISRTKALHGVTCAYLLLPEKHSDASSSDKRRASNQDDHDASAAADDSKKKSTNKKEIGPSTRVHFFSEFVIPKNFGFNVASLTAAASDKLVKKRLIRLADSCERLSVLVQRQRLGVQDAIDYTRVLPPTNTPCMVCTKMLVVAKVCRLCGMGVCADCSQKHERATQPRGSATVRIESIRVCASCLHRVNRACYENLTPSSLRGPHIVPDPIDAATPTVALRNLLHDALVQAPSQARKLGVMNVIKCVLDQEAAGLSASSASASSSFSSSRRDSSMMLTPTSSEEEYIEALGYLEVEHVPHEHATCRTHEDRCYSVEASDPDAALNAPLSVEEEARLRAVEQVDMDELADSVELNLLCHLAAQEMNCSTSTISIFDRDSLNCVATNVDAYTRLKLPRWNTICAHTILDKRPHLIPHPESDIRMADALIVTGFGVRFYFAFPVVDANEQIVGSFCVMNEQFNEITESQYAAFKKLSETCDKVVRIHTETRRRRKSSTSSNSNSNSSNSTSSYRETTQHSSHTMHG